MNLGELIQLFEDVKNKNLPVRIFDTYPSGFCSWRGYYAELAICYGGSSDGYCGEETGGSDLSEYGLGYYPYYDKISTKMSEPTAQEFLDSLCNMDGAMFEGWKGGYNTMYLSTRLWVANPGDCTVHGEPLTISGILESDVDVELTTIEQDL